MGGSGEQLPDLDDFIHERHWGPCRYVRTVPEEARRLIEAKIAEQRAAGKSPTWQAFCRWLAAAGFQMNKETLRLHYADGHADDR